MSYTMKISKFPINKKGIFVHLEKNNIKYNAYFEDYVNHHKYKIVEYQELVTVVILSVSELGFDKPATFTEIKNKALLVGYKACNPNTGFYLRMAMKDQEVSKDSILSQGKHPNSAIGIFTDQIEEDINFPRSAYLRNVDGQLWIRASRFDDLYEFDIDSRWAFEI